MVHPHISQDSFRQVLRIAECLDMSCTKEFLEEVDDKCTFDKLKNNKIDYTALLDKDQKSNLFRKGKE